MSQEFQFITIADAFCTGSSMMPQKKNPDVLELVRGKVGRIYAALTGMLTLGKGLPQAYNRDLQEDKIHLFSGHDTLAASLEIVAAVARNTSFNVDRCAEATERGYLDATILAEYMVARSVPFRQAHQYVGKLVAHAERTHRELSDLSIEEFQRVCERIETDVYDYLGPANVVARYQSEGNAGSASATAQIAYWREQLTH
jgi:argininosuccinate lyase